MRAGGESPPRARVHPVHADRQRPDHAASTRRDAKRPVPVRRRPGLRAGPVDLLSDPSRSFTPRELLAYGFRHPNTFAPGEKFQYSDTNLTLLGLVIEKTLFPARHPRARRPVRGCAQDTPPDGLSALFAKHLVITCGI